MNNVGFLLPFFFNNSPDDQAQDPLVNEAIQKAGATTNADVRKSNYKAIFSRLDNAYWVPLFTMPINFVFAKKSRDSHSTRRECRVLARQVE